MHDMQNQPDLDIRANKFTLGEIIDNGFLQSAPPNTSLGWEETILPWHATSIRPTDVGCPGSSHHV
jgi:hypothetical protein